MKGYSQERAYLSVVCLSYAEQRLKRIVSWYDEAGNVHEELASDVEEDEEEVDPEKAEESIDFGDGGLLLQVVEHRILGKLSDYLLAYHTSGR